MVKASTVAVGAVGSVVAAVGAWNLYQRATTERVPYTVVDTVDGVELRHYPPTVLVETTARSENEAFRRLFRYITGANEGVTDVAMTAPVEVETPREGRSIEMTTPVEIEKAGRVADAPEEGGRARDDVRMGFYLPSSFDLAAAPRPSDDRVDLVAVPERTLAVRTFTWRPTDRRVAAREASLLATLQENDVSVVDEPFYMGYDAPGTLPFLRRNEVAVAVDVPSE